MTDEERKIVTEARDQALDSARERVGMRVEFEFLNIAQKLDEILRPELIAKLRRGG